MIQTHIDGGSFSIVDVILNGSSIINYVYAKGYGRIGIQ